MTQKYHPLTLTAFILAVLVLIVPSQADIVFGALFYRRTTHALLVVALTLLIVGIPLAIAQVHTRRHPDRWKPRLLAPVTWTIIILNIVLNVIVFSNYLMKTKGEASGLRLSADPRSSQPQP